MVKKSLIAIALVGILASTSFAGDLAKGYWKFDDGWPVDIEVDWTELELCQIPIYIDIGMYIELEDCGKLDKYGKPIKKIILEQVQCDTLTTKGHASQFPCYKGCEDLKVRSNFDAILGLKLYRRVWGSDPEHSFISTYFDYFTFKTLENWTAFFDDGGTAVNTWPVTGDGNANDFTVCVEAWDVNVYVGDPEADPVSEVNRVGELAITVVPDADIDLCSLLCKCSGGVCVPKGP
jgi:hypothetical protein